jgi:hypothetical protein
MPSYIEITHIFSASYRCMPHASCLAKTIPVMATQTHVSRQLELPSREKDFCLSQFEL